MRKEEKNKIKKRKKKENIKMEKMKIGGKKN